MSTALATTLVRAIGTRLVVLAIAFAAVPVILAGQFLNAEAGKRATLLRTVQAEGHLLAEGLRLGIEQSYRPLSVVETRSLVERIEAKGMNMRLMLRPAADPSSIYLIAASPPLPADKLDQERKQLVEAGIVSHIPASCDNAASLDLRYKTASAREEVMSSITPFASAAGCWAIITSHSTNDAVGSLLGRPYWQAPEVKLAAIIYGLLALFSISLFAGVWRGLLRFARQARSIGTGSGATSFAAENRIPELNGVAREFDRMVAGLRASAEAVRRAAEDDAHAFKTPIATIAQALEPLRRSLPEDDTRGRRSLQLIEASVGRLDSLVTAARRMDEANALVVNPPHERIDLSQLAATLLATYDDIAAERGVRLQRQLTRGCKVLGGSDMLETVIENVLDNAISFTPAGKAISVKLAREGGQVVLTIEDDGPGATPEVLTTMFERYVSHRPDPSGAPGEQHFGIGLWVVRRNVESIGGRVHAENRGAGGLRMVIMLPALQKRSQ
jgi:two-component system sensor histidine kinase ChvG